MVNPEALSPFGTDGAVTVKKRTYILKSAEENPKNRHTNPVTSDRHYTTDEVEFMNALSEFKRLSGRLFPTCSEILGILYDLGYEKAKK